MERAQVGHLYWKRVQLDRTRGIAELQAALAEDSSIFMAVPLNLLGTLVELRQFERADSLGRRIARWPNVGSLALSSLAEAQAAQGNVAAADSTLARLKARYGPHDARFAEPAAMRAIEALHPDVADSLLVRAEGTGNGRVQGTRLALARLRGQLAAARRIEDRMNAERVSIARTAGARVDPIAGLTLDRARTELWLRHDPAAALRLLDGRWKRAGDAQDAQDRIDGADAAALYAAAGRPRKARALLAALDRGADTLGRRATYEHRQAALGEIALAEGRYRAATDAFRRSDLAADGLPVSACAVCILPHLARTAERAGWADSARGFWDAYVSRPAVDRLQTDQWFLATAYRKLATYAAARGDSEAAAGFARRLAAVRARADP
jgi:tetratricopeptide (TPR) repeat protein